MRGRLCQRRISPRTFAHDGLRWHVRAFCHTHGDFRDFVVGRMSGCRQAEPCPHVADVDVDWHSQRVMVIRPNPALGANQRKAIEMDYGMRRGQLRLSVRKALRIYVARRLGFIGEESGKPQPVLNELGQLQWVQ